MSSNIETAPQGCRTCYESSINNFHLLNEKIDRDSQKCLADLLLEIAKIDIKSENAINLPLQICGNCSRKLKNAYSFVQQAQRVNECLLLANLRASRAGGSASEIAASIELISKHNDCLLEAPIDIPSPKDIQKCLQIKMETDYPDENIYDVLTDNIDSNYINNDKNTESNTEDVHDAIIANNFKHEVMHGLQEEPSSSNAALIKLDPITIAETSWGDEEDGEDEDYVANEINYSESESDDESPESPARRRPQTRRGRPRSAKSKGDSIKRGCFKCETCNKTFMWKKDLQRHENVHFAEPLHKCDLCERRFLRKDKLRDHIKTHSKPRRAARNLSWNFADRLYTPHRFLLIKCKLCNGSFETVDSLRQHIYIHVDPLSIPPHMLQMENNIIKEIYPLLHDLAEVKATITDDISQDRLAKFYAVINAFGYEMCLSDSDMDPDDDAAVSRQIKYECELCKQKFPRKYKVIAHTKEQHANDNLPYKCIVCKAEFVSAKMHEMHLRTQCRSKEKKYQCLKCPGKFMWVENLEEHKCANRFNSVEYTRQVRRKRDVFKCNICSKTYVWMKDLKRHLETHDAAGGSHECSICCQHFIKAENLRQHIHQAHKHLSRCLECRLCELKFQKLSELRTHVLSHADGFSGVNMATGSYFKVDFPEGCAGRETEVAERISADFAGKNLARYYAAVDESGNELDLYDSETDAEVPNVKHNLSDCDSETDAAANVEATAAVFGTTYACELCAEVFTRRKRLLLHQNSEHDGVKPLPYECTECSEQFVCDALLQNHISRDCRNTSKQFRCEKCGMRFVWQKNLRTHMQLKHIDPEQQISRQLANKLQCDQCDKVFIWPKDLTRHKRVHMPDDEKFECPFCDRKFNRKDNMHSHMKVHGPAAMAAATRTRKPQKKPLKVKEINVNLCKPHGCKCIQCMICLSKHSKISDLRTHLRTHQYVVSFSQRPESISDLSLLFYPDKSIMSEEQLIERIIVDITAQQLERFYSITNEVGYELSLSSSETESDSENEDSIAAALVKQNYEDDSTRRSYYCDLCGASFKRKYKIFEHQMWTHDWKDANHLCVFCNARFLSNDLLQFHYKQQCKNTQKRYQCRKCPCRFMWKENFKMHVSTMHAERDETKTKPDSFECMECNRIFQMQKDLTRHLVTHRADTTVFKCLWCPRKFYRKENLHMHINRHGITPDLFTAAECVITATSSANGPKQICCKMCNLQFDSIAALRTHLLESVTTPHLTPHHDMNSLLNYSITNKLGFELQLDDSETDEDVEDSMMCSKKHQYTCEICNLICKRKFEMFKHQRSMHKHEHLPFKCERCVFKTASKDILTHHMDTQCFNMEKKYPCEKCSFRFMWEENLQTHMALMHPAAPDITIQTADAAGATETATETTTTTSTGTNKTLTQPLRTKIFPCEQCNRKYNRKDRLNAHVKKVHVESGADGKSADKSDNSQIDPATGQPIKKIQLEKKFLCAFCGRAVTSSSNLIVHMRRHTGEKPFKCDFCDMAFPRSSDLQCHRRTHTGEKPHKCTVCDKAFSRSYKLLTHMRIHSGERPYKCTYCEKTFTQSNDLTLHVRRHTGERPYVCGICGERFIQGTALKNHRIMQSHFEDVEPRRSILEQF